MELDQQQFNMLTAQINSIKTDLKGDLTIIRAEQVSQGKIIASVCTKVKAHAWIHRTSGLAILGVFVAWFKTKFYS